MKIPAQDRSRRTLNRIMAAAVDAFALVGVDNATVAEIVRDARSSVGSFYGRFSSKDDLVIAIDVLLWSEVDDRWRSSLYELAGVGADPLSDSVTDLRISISSSGGPSMLSLSRAVFGALRPALVARTRASAYLERNGRPTEETRVMEAIRTDVLRTLRGTEAVDTAMAEFLAGVVLKAAVDSDAGDRAPDHLAHVLSASLGLLASSPVLVSVSAPMPVSAPVRQVLEVPKTPTPAEPPAVHEPAAQPQDVAAEVPTQTPEETEPPSSEAFDIWT